MDPPAEKVIFSAQSQNFWRKHIKISWFFLKKELYKKQADQDWAWSPSLEHGKNWETEKMRGLTDEEISLSSSLTAKYSENLAWVGWFLINTLPSLQRFLTIITILDPTDH